MSLHSRSRPKRGSHGLTEIREGQQKLTSSPGNVNRSMTTLQHRLQAGRPLLGLHPQTAIMAMALDQISPRPCYLECSFWELAQESGLTLKSACIRQMWLPQKSLTGRHPILKSVWQADTAAWFLISVSLCLSARSMCMLHNQKSNLGVYCDEAMSECWRAGSWCLMKRCKAASAT